MGVLDSESDEMIVQVVIPKEDLKNLTPKQAKKAGKLFGKYKKNFAEDN